MSEVFEYDSFINQIPVFKTETLRGTVVVILTEPTFKE